MTYYGPKEIAAAFRTVRGNTLQIAESIPEDKYAYRATPECRSVAETLVHIAVMPRVPKQIHFVERRKSLAGFDFFALRDVLHAETLKPRSKADIVELLRTEGDDFAKLLESSSEDFLAEIVEYPQGMTPPTKSRFEMLIAAKEHEMHHRGQLMVIQRLIGQTPHLTRQIEERLAAMREAAAGKS